MAIPLNNTRSYWEAPYEFTEFPFEEFCLRIIPLAVFYCNPMNFELDPFQKKALEWIEKEHSVFVAAPTGAGKTLIAEAAIEKALARNEAAIYTAPIKALSNQKYRDFRAKYGEERVGILTGDVSINADALILIMTTEIYRNSLFEDLDRIRKVGWVIFDEVHYLDDPERGTVWEEALLFTPVEIRILALSATIPNVKEMTDWLQKIHNRPIAVVEETHRPVPLKFLFQCQGRIFDDTHRLFREGYLNRESWRLSHRQHRRGFHLLRTKPNRLETLISSLKQRDQLPAIYFAFGRRRTETLAWEAVSFDFLNENERQEILTFYRELLERYGLDEEPSAKDLRPLVEHGIAYHHAGMLPTLKEVVEQLFTSRKIKLIFTTETFALGINMPARSVIFDELEKFYGTSFRILTTRDFYQMAGRAGRRGMDSQGFVYIRVHPPHIAFPQLQRVIFGKPEPVQSQLNTTYATLLNLYRNLGLKLTDIYPRSLHHFQSSAQNRSRGLESIENKLNLLKEMGYIQAAFAHNLSPSPSPLPLLGGEDIRQRTDPPSVWRKGEGVVLSGVLSLKGEFAASLFGYELLLGEMHEEGVLEGLDEAGLNVLLAGLAFEPRKGDHPPRLSKKNEKLRRIAEHYSHFIYRKESKFQIRPYSKIPHFNLAEAIEAWTHGASFDHLFQLTSADEGELVRYFRMVIQLLREIENAFHTSEGLRRKAQKARALINRDVVDAEKQLRV